MARITAPAFVVQMVNELCIWYETHESSNPLSYPSKTVEARANEGRGGVAKAIVPLAQVPRGLVIVDRAIREMPDDWREAVLWRHLGGSTAYCRETGRSRGTMYNYADRGYFFVLNRINKELDKRI